MSRTRASTFNYHHLIATLSDEDIRKILDKHFKEDEDRRNVVNTDDTIVLGRKITKTKNKKNNNNTKNKSIFRFFTCFKKN